MSKTKFVAVAISAVVLASSGLVMTKPEVVTVGVGATTGVNPTSLVEVFYKGAEIKASAAEANYTDAKYTQTYKAVTLKDEDGNKVTQTTADGKYELSVFKHTVTHTETDEKGKEVKVTDVDEYIMGISGMNADVGLDIDLSSLKYTMSADFESAMTEANITLTSKDVVHLGDKMFSGKSIKTINLGSIQSVGASAFADCPYITTVTIPATVGYIGNDVFNGSGLKTLDIKAELHSIPTGMCADTKLSTITFADESVINHIGNNAFKNCVLTSFPVSGDGVTMTIGENAFAECVQLTSIDIPDRVAFVGASAFADCSGAKTLTMGKNLIAIDKSAFSGCTALQTITFNTALQSMGGGVFANCTALKEVTGIPESMFDWTEVAENTGYGFGNAVFSGCTSLRSVKLPSTLTYVPDELFLNCTSLTDIVFSGSIVGIGEKAFTGCKNLQEVFFESEIDTIGASAFSGCTSLRSMPVESCNTVMANAFENCTSLTEVKLHAKKYGTAVFKGCTGLEFADILGLTFTTFPEHMFNGCTSLKAVTNNGNIGFGGVKIVGEYAFYNCKSLVSAEMPNAVILEEACFAGCSALKSICDGDIVAEDYADSCFEGCTSLEQAVNATASTVGKKAFYGSGITQLSITGTVGTTAVFGDSAFANCANMEKAVLLVDEGIEYSIGNGMFSGCTSLKTCEFNGIEVTDNMFAGCTELKRVVLENATIAGDSAFADCASLVSLDIPANFTAIGAEAFNGCASLSKTYCDAETSFTGTGQYVGCANIHEATVSMLTKNMFEGCSGLSSVQIGKSISVLPDSCFKDCSALADIDLSSITEFGKYSMSNTAVKQLKLTGLSVVGVQAFASCSELGTISIEATELDDKAFTNCMNLYRADLQVGSIGASAFSGCENLQKLNLIVGTGTQLTSIGTSAFAGCTLLREANIPDTVTTIATSAFSSFEKADKSGDKYIIIGAVGSTAEEFATKQGYTFVSTEDYDTTGRALSKLMKGDLNLDGLVTVADAVRMQKWMLNMPVGVYTANIDMNGDLKMDGYDLAILKRKLLE